jgi:hypothetical protein
LTIPEVKVTRIIQEMTTDDPYVMLYNYGFGAGKMHHSNTVLVDVYIGFNQAVENQVELLLLRMALGTSFY